MSWLVDALFGKDASTKQYSNSSMTESKSRLLLHYSKQLKLPTILREYAAAAVSCTKVRSDSVTRRTFPPSFTHSFTFDDLASCSSISTHAARGSLSLCFTFVPQF